MKTLQEQIIAKQDELIEHFKAYYDAQNSPAVKLIEPQWYNYLNQLESELSSLKAEAEKEVTDADIAKWADMVQPVRGGYKTDYIFAAKAMRDGKIKAHRDNLIKKG